MVEEYPSTTSGGTWDYRFSDEAKTDLRRLGNAVALQVVDALPEIARDIDGLSRPSAFPYPAIGRIHEIIEEGSVVTVHFDIRSNVFFVLSVGMR